MFPAERNPRIERAEFQLRAQGIKREQMQNPLRTGTHTRGYLPHVKREGATYFVTFRLADSLPQAVLLKIQGERAQRLTAFYAQQDAARKTRMPTPAASVLDDIERDYFRKIEAYLDRGNGECWLGRPEVAELVASALRFFAGERYLLNAWVIMPNHVHAVLWPMPNNTLSEIMKSVKRYSAREANKLLNRTGQQFWQPEPFDHWIRNGEERDRCCRYVVKNPVKAQLCAAPEKWKWSSAWRER
jgi:REP element-mobilizing transposase RayT